MAELDAAAREKLSAKTFGIVQKVEGKSGETLTRERFPMPDKIHAANAKSRLAGAKGLSSEEKARIKAKANRILYGKSEAPADRTD